MYRLEAEDFVKKRFIALWSLLAFQAGTINSIGFLACQRYVSHVTGFGSQVGLTMGQGRYLLALELACAPLSFIAGAWFSGHHTVARIARNLRPRYDWVTAAMPVGLLALWWAGVNGRFGPFGEPLILGRDLFFLSCLSFFCGLQNATFATLTKGQIRTTHLTGISTDFGTDLAMILSGRLDPGPRRLLRYKNFMRAATFGAFSGGAVLAALWGPKLEYSMLAVPVITSTVVASVFWAIRYDFNHGTSGAKRTTP